MCDSNILINLEGKTYSLTIDESETDKIITALYALCIDNKVNATLKKNYE